MTHRIVRAFHEFSSAENAHLSKTKIDCNDRSEIKVKTMRGLLNLPSVT